jgi:hypothetical protein
MNFYKTNIWKLLVLTFLINHLATSAFSQIQQSEKPGISFEAADDSDVSIFIVLKDLPEQKFLFTVPEIFLAENFKEGAFMAELVPWQFKDNTIFRKSHGNRLAYRVDMSANQKDNVYWINWTINFENKSKDTIRNLSAFNCLTMHHAPMFKDTAMVNTWVKDAKGDTISLKSVQRLTGNGRRTMQFYPSANGIKDLHTIPWLRDWQVISPQTLSGNSMWLYSPDKSWKIETMTEGKGQPAFFFNNFEHDHGCIHSSPLLAQKLAPGETTSVSGKFIFTKLL